MNSLRPSLLTSFNLPDPPEIDPRVFPRWLLHHDAPAPDDYVEIDVLGGGELVLYVRNDLAPDNEAIDWIRNEALPVALRVRARRERRCRLAAFKVLDGEAP